MGPPLHERVAVVTGATRGIGAAIAKRLRSHGATVIVTGTSADHEAPQGCEYRAVDFFDSAATAAFAAELAVRQVDILVNNAGINAIAPFNAIVPAEFDRIHCVNVRAPFLMCQAVLPGMRSRQWGRIINIGSIFSVISKEQRASYSASKFALDGMTAALAAEVASDGVLANCVSPGFIETDLTRGILTESGIAELVDRIPMRRLGQPAEVAALVAWLASPENTYISGQNIVIDGGFSRV